MIELNNVPGLSTITIRAGFKNERVWHEGYSGHVHSDGDIHLRQRNHVHLHTSRVWKVIFKNISTDTIDVVFTFSRHDKYGLVGNFEKAVTNIRPKEPRTLVVEREHKHTRLEEVRVFSNGQLLSVTPQAQKLPSLGYHWGFFAIMFVTAGFLAVDLGQMPFHTGLDIFLPFGALILACLAIPGLTPTWLIAAFTVAVIFSTHSQDSKNVFVFFCVLYLFLMWRRARSWRRFLLMSRL